MVTHLGPVGPLQAEDVVVHRPQVHGRHPPGKTGRTSNLNQTRLSFVIGGRHLVIEESIQEVMDKYRPLTLLPTNRRIHPGEHLERQNLRLFTGFDRQLIRHSQFASPRPVHVPTPWYLAAARVERTRSPGLPAASFLLAPTEEHPRRCCPSR